MLNFDLILMSDNPKESFSILFWQHIIYWSIGYSLTFEKGKNAIYRIFRKYIFKKY